MLPANFTECAKVYITGFVVYTQSAAWRSQPKNSTRPRTVNAQSSLRDLQNCSHKINSLFIARQHTDARYWYSKSVCLSVCLSVRPSVCPWRSGIKWKRLNISSQFFLPYEYGSPIILVLPASNIFTKFRRVTLCGGDKYRWGIKISRFSTNKSLYLANDTKFRHSYYRRRIGNLSNGTNFNDLEWPLTPISR